MNLFTGESSRALFGGDAPESVNRLLHEAAAAHADPTKAEALLWSARLSAPHCLAVYFAQYKFYFYRRRLEDAERCARDGLRVAGEQARIGRHWREVQGGDADFGGVGPARFWLFTLKALAFIRLRLGDRAEAQALLDKAAQLDPDDNLGASVIARLKDESAPTRKAPPKTPSQAQPSDPDDSP
ncbi:hypothetical protein [Zoogloea sp.]|uniref:hypothetical protein n=1 Tax=Zoogloea sp. TaxID=49181 RepID=UPI001415BB69|nr:MAG: hypothetical protein F9K15_22000 [Zoogloea sp.]